MMINRQKIDDVKDHTTYEITVENEGEGLSIRVPGYGTSDMEPGAGPVVLLEMRYGVPFILVWGDIETEEPTHTICLKGAAESLRRE